MNAAAPTALIADDEPLLRERLATLLADAWPALQIVAQARNGREAVELCAAHEPGIAFLDIRMPLMSGIDAARMLPAGTRIVFVTAYEEYALRAFETGAVDYLVKPIDPVRLAATVERLKERMRWPASPSPHMEALLAQLSAHLRPNAPQHLEWIRASVGQQVRLVPVNDVLFFQSDDKYTRVVTPTTEVLIRKSIKELLDEIDPQRFAQIHRSTIVNLHAVDHVDRGDTDWLALHIKGSSETLRVSRNFVHLFRQM